MRHVIGLRGARVAATAVAGTVLTGVLATVLAAAAAVLPSTAASAMVMPPGLPLTQTAVLARAASSGYPPPGRTLRYGMHGADVRRLQRRLAQLRYYPGPRDGGFGIDTLEALWAFQEVQRIPATGQVGPRTAWRLGHPRSPRPLISHGPPLRVEVDLRHEVLYVYHRGRIVLISHVSSGGGYYYCSAGSCSYAITPAGNFRTQWRVQGWHVSPLGLLYNPVFFYGGYAIHGDTDVPLQPVSHGCVRIPMDVANIFPGLVPRDGIPVYLRR